MRVGSVTFKPNFGEITLDRKSNVKTNIINQKNDNVAKDDEVSLVIKKNTNDLTNNLVSEPIADKNFCKRPFLSVTARK